MRLKDNVLPKRYFEHIDQGQVTPYAGDYQYYLDKTGAGEDARAAVTAGKEGAGGKLVLENRQAG